MADDYTSAQNLAALGVTAVATSAKVTDPDAATATVIGLLRGILEKLGEIEVNTSP